MNLRIGFQSFEFYRTPETPRILEFSSTDDALRWLKHISEVESDTMRRLRDYAAGPAGIPNFARLTDEQTLERLALALFSRHIVVLAQGPRNIGAAPTKQPEASQPAFPISERSPRAASTTTKATPTSDPATFSPNLDAPALAASLVAAAAGGSPFCPECTKAAQGAAGNSPGSAQR